MSENISSIKLKKIGVIKTPYVDSAPYQPVDEDEGEFCIVLDNKYVEGLAKLVKFWYIYYILFRSCQRRGFCECKTRVGR